MSMIAVQTRKNDLHLTRSAGQTRQSTTNGTVRELRTQSTRHLHLQGHASGLAIPPNLPFLVLEPKGELKHLNSAATLKTGKAHWRTNTGTINHYGNVDGSWPNPTKNEQGQQGKRDKHRTQSTKHLRI